jgi:hypothetical protein
MLTMGSAIMREAWSSLCSAPTGSLTIGSDHIHGNVHRIERARRYTHLHSQRRRSTRAHERAGMCPDLDKVPPVVPPVQCTNIR